MQLRMLFNQYFPPGSQRRQRFFIVFWTGSFMTAMSLLQLTVNTDPYPTIIEWTLDPFANRHSTTIPATYFQSSLDLMHILPGFYNQTSLHGVSPWLTSIIISPPCLTPLSADQNVGELDDVAVMVDGVPVKHFATLELVQPSKHTTRNAGTPIGKIPLDRVALAPELGNRLSLSRLVKSGVSISIPGGPNGGQLMYLTWGGEFGGNLTAQRLGEKWTVQTMVADEMVRGDLMGKFGVEGKKSWCEINGWCYGQGERKRFPQGNEEEPVVLLQRVVTEASEKYQDKEREQRRARAEWRKILGERAIPKEVEEELPPLSVPQLTRRYQ